MGGRGIDTREVGQTISVVSGLRADQIPLQRPPSPPLSSVPERLLLTFREKDLGHRIPALIFPDTTELSQEDPGPCAAGE